MRVPSPLSCWIGIIWLAAQVKSQLLACPSLDNLFTPNSVLTRVTDTVGKNYSCTRLDFEFDNHTAVSANAFAGMPQLTTIYLESNAISELPAGLFNGTPMLQHLYLSYNYISELPPGLFNGTPMLQTLHLEDNQITALPYGIFSNTANLGDLNLQGNPLQCCEISGLLSLPDGVWPSDAVTCYLNGATYTLQNATALLALYPNSCPCSDASNCAVQGTACVSGQTFKQCSNCSTGFFLNDNVCSGCLAGNECNNSVSIACPSGTYSAANASSCTTIQPGYYCLSYNTDHGCTAISVSNSQAASASSSTLVMVAAVIAGILLVGA